MNIKPLWDVKEAIHRVMCCLFPCVQTSGKCQPIYNDRKMITAKKKKQKTGENSIMKENKNTPLKLIISLGVSKTFLFEAIRGFKRKKWLSTKYMLWKWEKIQDAVEMRGTHTVARDLAITKRLRGRGTWVGFCKKSGKAVCGRGLERRHPIGG